MSETASRFLTAGELCDRWKVSHMFLWRLRRDKKIKAHRIGQRIRFSLEEIQKFEAAAQS